MKRRRCYGANVRVTSAPTRRGSMHDPPWRLRDSAVSVAVILVTGLASGCGAVGGGTKPTGEAQAPADPMAALRQDVDRLRADLGGLRHASRGGPAQRHRARGPCRAGDAGGVRRGSEGDGGLRAKRRAASGRGGRGPGASHRPLGAASRRARVKHCAGSSSVSPVSRAGSPGSPTAPLRRRRPGRGAARRRPRPRPARRRTMLRAWPRPLHPPPRPRRQVRSAERERRRPVRPRPTRRRRRP